MSETLFFGRNIPGAGRPDSARVTDDQWGTYADSVLTRLLPTGATTLDGQGRYLENGQPVSESTKIVIVVHAPTALSSARVDSAIAIYRQRFKQESVGRVTTAVTSGLCD